MVYRSISLDIVDRCHGVQIHLLAVLAVTVLEGALGKCLPELISWELIG